MFGAHYYIQPIVVDLYSNPSSAFINALNLVKSYILFKPKFCHQCVGMIPYSKDCVIFTYDQYLKIYKIL